MALPLQDVQICGFFRFPTDLVLHTPGICEKTRICNFLVLSLNSKKNSLYAIIDFICIGPFLYVNINLRNKPNFALVFSTVFFYRETLYLDSIREKNQIGCEAKSKDIY